MGTSVDFSRGFLSVLRAPVEALLRRVLADTGLDSVDGRPLYMYVFGTVAFKEMQTCLRKALNAYHTMRLGNGVISRPKWLSQLFVLYGAHWFRREFTGGHQAWAKLDILPNDFCVLERGRLVRDGLRAWQIQVFESGHGRQWLHTLALNGGIPSTLLAGQERSWVTAYFDAIVSDPALPSAHTPESHASIAQRHAMLLKEHYREPEIIEQAARLLAVLSKWRAARPDGLAASAAADWMEARFPEWTHECPLYVGEDPAVLRDLVARLLTLEVRKPDRGLEVQRALRIQRGEGGGVEGWFETARVLATGTCDAGDFSLGAGDEGAVVYLVAAERRVGRADVRRNGSQSVVLSCRGLGGQGVSLGVLPLTEPVTVVAELPGRWRKPGWPLWRGGEARSGPVRIFDAQADEAGEHALLGTGSVGTTAPSVLVLIPANAPAEAMENGSCELQLELSGQALFKVTGRACVRVGSDVFRIATGQAAEDSPQLRVGGIVLDGFELCQRGRVLCRAPVRLAGDIDITAVTPSVGWHAAGRQSLAWRDADGFLLDRALVFAVPQSARMVAFADATGGLGADTILEWQGLDNWNVCALIGEGHSAVEVAHGPGRRGRAHFDAGLSGAVELVLTDPQGRTTRARLVIRRNGVCVRDGDGRRFDGPFAVSLPQLHSMMLDTSRSETLVFGLKRQHRVVVCRRIGAGRYSMNAFSAIIEGLLAEATERGPEVRVRVLGGRDLGTVRRPPDPVPMLHGSILGAREAEQSVVFRPLLDPQREYEAQATRYGLRAPASVAGPCLVYRRSAQHVLTRPVVADVPREAVAPTSRLSRIALIQDPQARLAALRDVFAGDNPASTVKELLPVVASLRGLSPRSIDALALLPDYPDVLAAMLLEATDVQRPAVLELEETLPFQWPAIPQSSWTRQLGQRFTELQAVLAVIEPDNATPAAVMERMSGHLMRIAPDAPWLAAIPQAAPDVSGLEARVSELAGPFIDLWDERDVQTPMTDLFEGTQLLTGFTPISRLGYERVPALLAPLAFAAQSRRRARPSRAQTTLMRMARLLGPDFVHTAYTLAMRDETLWKD